MHESNSETIAHYIIAGLRKYNKYKHTFFGVTKEIETMKKRQR